MAQGMRPSVAHNPDPTYKKVAVKVTGEERNKARHIATVMKAVAEIAQYKVKEITLIDSRGNTWHMEVKS